MSLPYLSPPFDALRVSPPALGINHTPAHAQIHAHLPLNGDYSGLLGGSDPDLSLKRPSITLCVSTRGARVISGP
jgi:hypothetical protein